MLHQTHEGVTASVLSFSRILPPLGCLIRRVPVALEAGALLGTLVVHLGSFKAWCLDLETFPRVCSENCQEQDRLSLRTLPGVKDGVFFIHLLPLP